MKDINDRVFNGIRKTINRFREKPLYYFTEADLHSSLVRDILSGSSKELIIKGKHILLLHQEFPTSFRYKPSKMKEYDDCAEDDIKEKTKLSKKENGTRGHYDLAVINPNFIEKMLKKNSDEHAIKHIMNKSIKNKHKRKDELLFAIEVKFLHLFNRNHKSMINEVKKDIKKLEITSIVDNKIKCINLVFCSAKGTNNVSENIKSLITQNKNSPVLNIFIESYYDTENKKQTKKPITNYNKTTKWAKDLIQRKLKIIN